MTKSEIRDKQVCLPNIIFEVAISRDQPLKKSKILISIRFNLLQFCPSLESAVSVMLS